MNLTISAKNFKLTPALKASAAGKMGKLTKFYSRINRIGVELDVDHNAHRGKIYRVEVWVDWPGGRIQAGCKAERMQAAIDLVYPKLERQLLKVKEKHPRPSNR